MKILVISNRYIPYYIGGYEVSCWNIVKILKKRGHEVSVLTGNWKYPIKHKLSDKYVYRELIYRHVYRVGISLKDTIIREIKDNLTLKKIVRIFKPDLLYIFNIEGLSKSILTTAESLKIPIVHDISGSHLLFEEPNDNWLIYWQSTPRNKFIKFVKLSILGLITKHPLKKCFKRFFSIDSHTLNLKYLYFTSEWIKNRYLRHKFVLESAPIIHRGVDTKQFLENMRKEVNDENNIRLLYVGRLTEDKGPHIAIKALSILIEKGYKVVLSVVGTLKDKKYIKEYINSLQIVIRQKNLPVKFWGNVIYKDMPKIYSSNDIFIFPPVMGGPLSRTLLEAMGSGIGVVASSIGGNILKDSQNCLIAKTSDPNDFASKIEILIRNPELRKNLGINASEFIKENFDIERVVDKIENYLKWAIIDFKKGK